MSAKNNKAVTIGRGAEYRSIYNIDNVNHDIAFAGLVFYIEEVRMGILVGPEFKPTGTMIMCSVRLE